MNATTHLGSRLHHLVAPFALAAVGAVAGCTELAAPSPEQGEPAALTAREGRSEACVAQNQKLDAAAAAAPSNATYDALLATITPDCGASFHSGGPSHLDEHRLVRIGSNTKSYVATVTLGLVGEGRLALDGRLDAYLPDVPTAVGRVTLRQLLQHTSGIYDFTDSHAFWTAESADPMRRWAVRELLDLAFAQPPSFEPGARWEYSNTNYVLLGTMLEHVEGKPIAQLIRERILTPNGLAETFFDGGEPVVGELTPGYFVPGAEIPVDWFAPWAEGTDVSHAYDVSFGWAAGAMVATPRDVARFFELLGSGALLPPAVQTELLKGVDMPEAGLHYGLGVFLADASITGGAGPGIGHGGDVMGFHTFGMYFPETHTTLFGAVDSDKGNGNDVAVKALDALFPTSPQQQRRASIRLTSPRSSVGE
jgi:D-alanyl-D-alanine carboxypeptidase